MMQRLLHISYFPECITFNAIQLEEKKIKIWNITHAFPLDTAVWMFYWHSTENLFTCILA
jgi:hypothetical protein